MSRPAQRLVWMVLAVGLVCACKSAPTTVLLRIEAGAGLPKPDELRLAAFTPASVAVRDQRLPPCAATCAAPELPSEVVLYPREEEGLLRLHVRALKGASGVGEGVARVALSRGEQVKVTLTLRPGALPDADGDGVPDEIDSCPAIPNPLQGPCVGRDAGRDSAPDSRPRDLGLRERREGPSLLDRRRDLPPCTCPLGCTAAGACRKLVPANGFSAALSTPIPVISGEATINTTECTASMSGVSLQGQLQADASNTVTACVFGLAGLMMASGGKLSVEGSRPLVVIVSGDVTVAGVIDVGGHASIPGPGGGAGGKPLQTGAGQVGAGPGGGKVCGCTARTSYSDDCGGGGGGFGGAGGQGGPQAGAPACPTLALGGSAYGASSLVPLAAGSGGASGDSLPTAVQPGAGGGGGGALQISAQGTLTINGAITGGGGGGGPGTPTTSTSLGGGGGGSGGGILLEAALVNGTGIVAVNGGAGASGWEPSGCTANAGEDGGPTTSPAKGGQPSCAQCGKGGAGGAGAQAAGAGSAGATTCGGGGGGGAAGRIRLNSYQVSPSMQMSGIVSVGQPTVQ